MKGDGQNKPAKQWYQFWIGSSIIIICNGLVLIGIIIENLYLLLPWLITYGIGKKKIKTSKQVALFSGIISLCLLAFYHLIFEKTLFFIPFFIFCIVLSIIWVFINQFRQSIKTDQASSRDLRSQQQDDGIKISLGSTENMQLLGMK